MSAVQTPPGVVDSGTGSQNLVLHVLCPSLSQPNRVTLSDLAPSTTIRTLKEQLSETIPSRPSPNIQRLFYLGKPLLDDTATLQTILGSLGGSEFSIHLVLPPSSPQATSSSISPVADRAALPQNPLFHNRAAQSFVPHGQELRYRGPAASTPPSEAEIGLALRQNVDTIRRQLDIQERGGQPPRFQNHGNPTVAPAPSNLQTLNSVTPSTQTPWQQAGSGLPHTAWSPATPTTSGFSTSSNGLNSVQGVRNLNTGSIFSEEMTRLQLQILTQKIKHAEDRLDDGIVPPIEDIISVRTELFSLLDDQYQRPVAERGRSIEPLLTRVFNLYTRADQVRTIQARFPGLQQGFPATATNPPHPQAPLYLLSSPDGYQALVASPGGTGAIRTSLDNLRASRVPTPTFLGGGGPPPNGPPNAAPNANAAVLENVVRQAVLNQRAADNDQLGLARNIRRLWLFVRLYFFCYMFSMPGTWTRILFVALAAIVSILSETSLPRQLYQMILAPIQRHLEGLVHFTPEEQTPAGPQGAQPATNPQAGLQDGLRHNLRRAERSLALFLASLVPGVGERHVQVRNEAVRNAERAREEEERLRQEAAREQEQAPQTTTETEASGQNPSTENDPAPAVLQAEDH